MMKNPSRHEIEVRWKGAQLIARGWPATLCVIGAMLLLIGGFWPTGRAGSGEVGEGGHALTGPYIREVEVAHR